MCLSQAGATAVPRLGLLSRLPLLKSDGLPALTARYLSPRDQPPLMLFSLKSPSKKEKQQDHGLSPRSEAESQVPSAKASESAKVVSLTPPAAQSSSDSVGAGLNHSDNATITRASNHPIIVTVYTISCDAFLRAMPAVLPACFLLLPAVSNRIFRSFACRGFTLDDADLSERCGRLQC